MTQFLESEVLEIEAVRQAVDAALIDEVDLNNWFDQSEIKQRFKKARIRDQGIRCCYCKKFIPLTDNDAWDLEHVLCELHYPQFFAVAENLAIACGPCNRAKRDEPVLRPVAIPAPRIAVLPVDPERYSIPHPRFDDWGQLTCPRTFIQP